MMNEIFRRLNNPVLRTESETIDGRVYNTPIFHMDVSFFWAVYLPLGLGALLLLFGLILFVLGVAFDKEVGVPIFFCVIGLLAAGIGGGLATLYRRVPPDMLAAVQFLGPVKLYTDCLVFAPRAFTQFALFTGSQEVMLVDVAAQVKLNSLETGAKLSDKSQAMTVKIKLAFRLAWATRPWQVVQNFLYEFRVQTGESLNGALDRAFQSVQSDLRDIVFAEVDAPLQQTHIFDLLHNVESVNATLAARLRDPIRRIGIALDVVAVEDVQDAIPDGFIVQYRRAIDAERTAESRARQAAADKNARLAQATAEQEAQQREQEAQREIALAKQATQKELIELARQQALTAVQDLAERLKVYQMDGAVRGQILRAIEQLQPEQLVPFVEVIASAAGIKTEGGSLLFAGGGGAQDARLVTALGIGVETLKSFGLLAPTVPAPAPAAPPAAAP